MSESLRAVNVASRMRAVLFSISLLLALPIGDSVAHAVQPPREPAITSITPDGPRAIRVSAHLANQARLGEGRWRRAGADGSIRLAWPRGARCARVSVSYLWRNAKMRRGRGRGRAAAHRMEASAFWCHPDHEGPPPSVVRTVPEFVPRGGGLVLVEVRDVDPSRPLEVVVGSVRARTSVAREVGGTWRAGAVLRFPPNAAGGTIELREQPPRPLPGVPGPTGARSPDEAAAAQVRSHAGPALPLGPAVTAIERAPGVQPSIERIDRVEPLGPFVTVLVGAFPAGIPEETVIVQRTHRRILARTRERLYLEGAVAVGDRVEVEARLGTETRTLRFRVRRPRPGR